MIIVLPFELPDLNTYIRAERGNRYAAASLKKKYTQKVVDEVAYQYAMIEVPVEIHFTWHCKNKRKDPDNISFGTKFLLDGLVEAGVLEGDSARHITGFTHNFVYGKNAGVAVEIIPAETAH